MSRGPDERRGQLWSGRSHLPTLYLGPRPRIGWSNGYDATRRQLRLVSRPNRWMNLVPVIPGVPVLGQAELIHEPIVLGNGTLGDGWADWW